MKKIYLSVCAMLFAAGAFAQVDITFQIDMSPYITAGGALPVTAGNIKIAGNFTTNGSTVSDWTPPSSPAFTNVSGNVYEATINFPALNIGGSLDYKFLLTTNSWGNCNDLSGGDTQECFDATSGACAPNGPDYNRNLIIPAVNTTICYDWNTCNACSGLGVKQNLANLANLTVSPNPSVNNTVISYRMVGNENVQVRVYNSLGAEVAVLANETQSVGVHKINWNTTSVDKGLYTVVVKTATGTKSTRIAVQ